MILLITDTSCLRNILIIRVNVKEDLTGLGIVITSRGKRSRYGALFIKILPVKFVVLGIAA